MESPRTTQLREELRALPEEIQRRLQTAGFDESRLISLAATLEGPAEERRTGRNRVRGAVSAPAANEILEIPEATSDEGQRLRSIGRDALANGEVAKVDDADPLSASSIEALKGVGVLTKLANDSANIAVNLLAANKDAVKRVNDPDAPDPDTPPTSGVLMVPGLAQTSAAWAAKQGVPV